jgi:hypothetical protein
VWVEVSEYSVTRYKGIAGTKFHSGLLAEQRLGVIGEALTRADSDH